MSKATAEHNLQISIPNLAKEWHPTKNGNLTPMEVTIGSSKKLWWQCSKGHEWEVPVRARSRGNGCPYCSGNKVNDENCLQTLNPSLATEWHPTKNGNMTPKDVTVGSNKKLWWQCSKGHEWEASVFTRSQKHGCPYCFGKKASDENCLQTINPSLAEEWHPTKNGNLTPSKVRPYSAIRAWWQCSKGHEWDAAIASRSQGNGCPVCHRQKQKRL